MPSRIFNATKEIGTTDATTFLHIIASNEFKACSSYPFIPSKISRHLALCFINAISPDRFENIEDMLRTAPIGIVQFFLIFSNDINLKIGDKFSVGELVLQRCDLNQEEFSLLMYLLQRQNYCGFSARTSSTLSIMENILVGSESIPDFEDKIESMIAAGIKVTPKTLNVACANLKHSCYTMIKTLCYVLNTIPYRTAIKTTVDRTTREDDDVFSCNLAAEIISALLSSITTFTKLSIEIPTSIIEIIDDIGFSSFPVLWGVIINGKRVTEVFSEDTCLSCIASPSSLFELFREGKISPTIFIDVITSFMKFLSPEHSEPLAVSVYKFYLQNQGSFNQLISEALVNSIEHHVNLADISPDPKVRIIETIPAITPPDTIIIGRRKSEENATNITHNTPIAHVEYHKDSTTAKETVTAGEDGLPPLHPSRRARATKEGKARGSRKVYASKPNPRYREPMLPSLERDKRGSKCNLAYLKDDENTRVVDVDESRCIDKFPPVGPIIPKRKKYRA